MSDLQTIENIRNLISQGRTKIAAEQLVVLTHTHYKKFYESALLLKNRLETLEQDTIAGVLTHEDKTVEQAKIIQSLLSLTSSVENAQVSTVNEQTDPQNEVWYKRRIIWMGTLLVFSIAALSYWGFSKIDNNKAVMAESDVFNLVLVIDMENKNTAVLTTNFCEVRLGNTPLSDPYIHDDNIVYQKISKKHWEDSINIKLLNHDYEIESKKEERASDKSVRTIVYKIIEKKKVFDGYVRFPDGQPAPSAIVEIGFQKKVFQATADRNGQYRIQLPLSAVKEVVSLTLKYRGKARINKNITVNEINMASWTLPVSSRN